MNTTNPREDLFADFFQVSGSSTKYSNFSSASANLMSGGGGSSSGGNFPLSVYASKGRKGGLTRVLFKKFTTLYDKVAQDFGLGEQEINDFWNDWKLAGNSTKDTSTFHRYVELQKGKVLQDQIIKDQKTLSENDVVDVSDVDFTKEDKKGISLLYIGLGAIVLVGATILIVRK